MAQMTSVPWCQWSTSQPGMCFSVSAQVIWFSVDFLDFGKTTVKFGSSGASRSRPTILIFQPGPSSTLQRPFNSPSCVHQQRCQYCSELPPFHGRVSLYVVWPVTNVSRIHVSFQLFLDVGWESTPNFFFAATIFLILTPIKASTRHVLWTQVVERCAAFFRFWDHPGLGYHERTHFTRRLTSLQTFSF